MEAILLKILGKKVFEVLLKYWKPLLGGIVLTVIIWSVNSAAVDRTNDKRDLIDAQRIESVLRADILAQDEAAKLKSGQDAAAASRLATLEAEKKAASARAEAAEDREREQRRIANDSTNDLRNAQQQASLAGDKCGAALAPIGVRDNLNRDLNKIRSRRQP